MSIKSLMTVEQFAQMQMHTADTEDYELVAGEVIPLSSGTYRHNKMRDFIGHLLWTYFRQHPIGEAVAENDCRTAPDEVRRPDLSIFLRERLDQIDLDKIPAPFPPDITVEVLSPYESAMEVRRKVRDYLRGGCKEVWLLDHLNSEVLVHTNDGIRILQATDVLESPVLPGFRVNVADLVVNS